MVGRLVATGHIQRAAASAEAPTAAAAAQSEVGRRGRTVSRCVSFGAERVTATEPCASGRLHWLLPKMLHAGANASPTKDVLLLFLLFCRDTTQTRDPGEECKACFFRK